jgi:hypothetical protein
VACDTDNNKLHYEKTPQLTKGQRYDRLKRKSTFQTSWKKKFHGVEASGSRADNHGDLISLKLDFRRHFLLCISRD